MNDYRLDDLIGFDLYKKTVGIVGTGKIGAAFSRIMKGFGCNLLAHDIYENQELIQETGITYTSLQNLCKQADVVAVFCPLTPQTKYLFNKESFNWMKPNAIFINVARGGVVNTRDMIDALNANKFAQAGLDVYENEPNPRKDLLNHSKIACTPHIGAATLEAQDRIGEELAQLIIGQFGML